MLVQLVLKMQFLYSLYSLYFVKKHFAFTCKRTAPALTPSLASFLAVLILCLLLQGKCGILSITPSPAGTARHSSNQLESNLSSDILCLSTPGWQEASCISSPGSDERRRTGERNAHTKVVFYEFISLKIYSGSCLHHAVRGVTCLSRKPVEKVASVFCCPPPSPHQIFWAVSKVYAMLTCIVCMKTTQAWNRSVRLLIVDLAGTRLSVTWQLSTTDPKACRMREICWNREVRGGKHLVHRRKKGHGCESSQCGQYGPIIFLFHQIMFKSVKLWSKLKDHSNVIMWN